MNTLAGTRRLARLALRRDRIQIPVWILAVAVGTSAATAAVADEFASEAEIADSLRQAGDSPAVLMLRGIPVGSSEGAMVNFRNFAFTLLLAGLMSTFMVVRHTRQNEETGRSELIGAASVGRHAGLAAALTVTLAADLLFGIAVSAMLLAAGLPAGGSVAFGAACAATGMAFAGIAAMAAQIFTTSRAANSAAATAVGVAFAVRGMGDALGQTTPDGVTVTSNWLAWLSPIGWGIQVRPFGAERWWGLALPILLLIVCAATAFAIVDRRDFAAGLLAARPGPARAAQSLLRPTGLAWRLNRGSVLGWAIGSAAFGFAVGTIGDIADDDLPEGAADLMEQLAGTGAASIVDIFYAGMMNVFGVLAAGFAVQALLRLRSEEAAGHAEAVLATATARVRWVAAHLACAVGGTVAVLLAAGLAAGIADTVVGGGVGIATLTGAALAQVPAALAVAGFVVLVFGGLPRLTTTLAWIGLAVSICFGLLGDVFGLPQAVRDMSPFSHIPAIPAADPDAMPIITLAVVAAVLVAAGMALFRRRDLVS
jgi:ABC-2 type transport system permease protein